MAVAAQGVSVQVEAMKWGMVLPNSNDLVVNGRLEELQDKPFFKKLLDRKRCVLGMNGYFEWGEDKTPFLITNKDLPPSSLKVEGSKMKAPSVEQNQVLQVACLFNNPFNKEGLGDQFNQFVVLTMESQGPASEVHHRMPVFLDGTTRAMWLDPKVSFETVVAAIVASQTAKGADLLTT